jgi:hypothetical protein
MDMTVLKQEIMKHPRNYKTEKAHSEE